MASAAIAQELGARAGLTVHSGPPGWPGQVRTPDGRRSYFVANRFDLNPHRAVLVTRDKQLTAYHLLSMGYPIPDGRVFGRKEIPAAHRYAEDLGFPVVVKPICGTNGRGVAVAHDELELSRALRFIICRRGSTPALIQEYVEGLDHRLVVLDGEILAAYVRRPLAVTGDGERSIDALLEAALLSLRNRGRRVELQLGDSRVDARLRTLHLTRASVFPAGETVALLGSANLSTGGEAEDVSDRIHPAYRQLASRLARDSGLRFCGIDLISVAPLAESPRGYWILELNAAPMLDHFRAMGPAQERRVEAIFERVWHAVARL